MSKNSESSLWLTYCPQVLVGDSGLARGKPQALNHQLWQTRHEKWIIHYLYLPFSFPPSHTLFSVFFFFSSSFSMLNLPTFFFPNFFTSSPCYSFFSSNIYCLFLFLSSASYPLSSIIHTPPPPLLTITSTSIFFTFPHSLFSSFSPSTLLLSVLILPIFHYSASNPNFPISFFYILFPFLLHPGISNYLIPPLSPSVFKALRFLTYGISHSFYLLLSAILDFVSSMYFSPSPCESFYFH